MKPSENNIIRYRVALDRWSAQDVIWEPYSAHRDARAFDERAWFSGLIHSPGYIGRHLPERFLRQYGHVQTIPRDPHALPLSYDVDVIWDTYRDEWETQTVNEEERGTHADPAWLTAPEYTSWYIQHSHPYVDRSEGLRALPDTEADTEADPEHDPAREAHVDYVEWATERFGRIATELDTVLLRDDVPPGSELYQAVYEVWQMATVAAVGPTTWRVRRRTDDPETSGAID
jgi:hypothetical protein